MTYERKYPDLKVYVGAAVWRTVNPLHMNAMVPLLRDQKRYAYLPQIGDALMERVRGISTTIFLRHTQGDVYLSLDSDIVGFTKDAIDELVEQAVDYDIVAGIYLTKAVARTFPSSTFEDDTSIEFANDSTPVPIKWAATGCLAVHRRVFERMVDGDADNPPLNLLHEADGQRAFYNFFHCMEYDDPNHGKILLSEDYAFCERARRLGFTIYANPAIRLGHEGLYIYRLEDMAGEVFKPQPLRITRSGKYWRIDCARLVETPEEMGRVPEGKGDEIRKRFTLLNGSRPQRRRKKKAVVPSGA